MAKNKRSLVILTLNEIDGLQVIFDRIPLNAVDEVVAVDGGSTDGTQDFFKNKRVKLVVQKRRGRGDAFREGIANSSGEHVVFFSPDGNEVPEDIPKLFEKLDEEYDLVIGSRFMKGSVSEDAELVHGFGNWMFTTIANVLFGTNVKDLVNGFREVKRSSVEKLKLAYDGFEIELQMTIRAAKLGQKIIEIPTREPKRIGGKAKLTAIGTGLLYLKYIFRELLIGKKF